MAENVAWTGWVQPRHLAWSLNYAQLLENPSLISLFSVMVSDQIRPPLFPASAAVIYKLFGRSADVASMVNVIYMANALGATYGIGRRRSGRRLGLISAVLLALFPMFYSLSRHFYLEFAVTAMVSLTVYLLLDIEGCQRRGISLLFGLSLGLGLLTKRTFAVCLMGPLLVVRTEAGLFTAAWQRLKRRPRVCRKNVLAALLAGLLPPLLWYLPSRENEHISSLLLVVGMLILLVAAIVHIRRHGSFRQALPKVQPTAWVVLSWVGVAYLLFTLSTYQETRAFTPALLAVALILGTALLWLPWRHLQGVRLAGLLAFGLLQLLAISYESVHRFVPNGSVIPPFWGRIALFAQGNYIQLPDENETDRGYWVEPDILQRREDQRPAPGMNPLQEQVINDILDGPPRLFDELLDQVVQPTGRNL